MTGGTNHGIKKSEFGQACLAHNDLQDFDANRNQGMVTYRQICRSYVRLTFSRFKTK